jgi:hypothetical protein
MRQAKYAKTIPVAFIVQCTNIGASRLPLFIRSHVNKAPAKDVASTTAKSMIISEKPSNFTERAVKICQKPKANAEITIEYF